MPRSFVLAATSVLAAMQLGAANLVVDTTADTVSADGFCSLREAIVAANADASSSECAAGTGTSDRILFDLASPATITLGSHLPDITESVALVGPGVDALEIDGGDLHRLVFFYGLAESDPWLLISGLTLTNGLADSLQGGAVRAVGNLVLRDCELSSSASPVSGGGLYIFGAATIERCRILGNSMTGAQGGGGIHVSSQSSLTLIDSTVALNSTSSSGQGGGIFGTSPSLLVVRSSTISGNATGGSGGGFDVVQTIDGQTTEIVIDSSTITQNQCEVGNSFGYGCGGGLRLETNLGGEMSVEMRNTIVAGNVDTATAVVIHDVFLGADAGLTFASMGYNWIGDNRGAATDFPVGSPNGNDDFAGDGAPAIDPGLAGLADNGGPTSTHAVSGPTSPILDKGSCSSAAADQRGYGSGVTGMRIVDLGSIANFDDGCDIGAFEASLTGLTPKRIFADGFESGLLLFWSADAP